MQAEYQGLDDNSIITAMLYGVGSIWGAANVIAAQIQPEESMSHLFVRLIPQMLFGFAALLHGIVAFRNSMRKPPEK